MSNTALKTDAETVLSFNDFSLPETLLRVLDSVGYETPTPIQSQIIPLVSSGVDVVGQAQTGTGKTAAFALPLLAKLDLKKRATQVLVLAPTRELAIQVAEAFQKYATHLEGFQVLPIYGGQDISQQLKQLKRGPQVVVGTPGRVMDHMRRGTLKLDGLKTLVLDEADEMLRMGFVDDVEWILSELPEERQIALFSATMPTAIRRIAKKYLKSPAEVTIKLQSSTAETIRQRYWVVSGVHKLDALTRILEAESFEGIIIFVRTKIATIELAEKLNARGFAASALNGDIPQNQRERTIDQLKKGKLDILVATDVAARGLDVERISHVVNYDIPYDTESYVHRIGRTGRAGRSGEAILFVSPREQRTLRSIEQATNKKIERMDLPSAQVVNDKRMAAFKQRITDTLLNEDVKLYRELIEQYLGEHDLPALDIAAALAKMVQGDEPLLVKDKPTNKYPQERESQDRPRRGERSERGSRDDHGARGSWEPSERKGRDNDRDRGKSKGARLSSDSMTRYRVDVGKAHNVKPGNLVGAIANEGDIEGRSIGSIEIFENYSTVDLPNDLSQGAIQSLQKVWVAGQQLNLSPMDNTVAFEPRPRRSDSGSSRPERSRSDRSDRPRRSDSDRPRPERSSSDRPRSERSSSERSSSERARPERSSSDRPRSERSGSSERAKPERARKSDGYVNPAAKKGKFKKAKPKGEKAKPRRSAK